MRKVNIAEIEKVLPAQHKAWKAMQRMPEGEYVDAIRAQKWRLEYWGEESNGYWDIRIYITSPSGQTMALPMGGVAPDGTWNYEKIRNMLTYSGEKGSIMEKKRRCR